MKKGFLLLVAAGSMLVSCGGGEEAKAADELCDCYEGWMKKSDEAGKSTSTDDLIVGASEIQDEMMKTLECEKDWKAKWDGKVDPDAVRKEIKENHKDVDAFFEGKGIKL